MSSAVLKVATFLPRMATFFTRLPAGGTMLCDGLWPFIVSKTVLHMVTLVTLSVSLSQTRWCFWYSELKIVTVNSLPHIFVCEIVCLVSWADPSCQSGPMFWSTKSLPSVDSSSLSSPPHLPRVRRWVCAIMHSLQYVAAVDLAEYVHSF